MTRGFYYSRSGMFRYGEDDYDIAAFVCLSVGRVFFRAAPIHRVSVRTTWLRLPGIDRQTFDLTLQTIQHRRNAAAFSWPTSMPRDLPPTAPQAPSRQASFNL